MWHILCVGRAWHVLCGEALIIFTDSTVCRYIMYNKPIGFATLGVQQGVFVSEQEERERGDLAIKWSDYTNTAEVTRGERRENVEQEINPGICHRKVRKRPTLQGTLKVNSRSESLEGSGEIRS